MQAKKVAAKLSELLGLTVGCIGNRVYTGLGDGELYFTIPGAALAGVVQKLETVVHANRELEQYHEGRRRAIGTPRG